MTKKSLLFSILILFPAVLFWACGKPAATGKDVSQMYLKYVNKYPDQCGFFEDPQVDKKLKSLLKSGYYTFLNNVSVQVPFKNENNILYFDGIAMHAGGFDEGILAIDLKNGLYHAAILSNSTALKLYTEDKKNLPSVVKEWIDSRAEENWQNVQTIEK